MPKIELFINKYKRLQHHRNVSSRRGQYGICELYSKHMGKITKKVKTLPKREQDTFYKGVTEFDYSATFNYRETPLREKGMRWVIVSKTNKYSPSQA